MEPSSLFKNYRYHNVLVTILVSACAVISLFALRVQVNQDGFTGINMLSILSVLAASVAGIVPIYLLRMKQRIREKNRIYIIYCHQDRVEASKIVAKLREAGFNPWFFDEEISPGQRIDQAILQGLVQCSIAILIVSKNLEEKPGYINFEINYALNSMNSKNELYSPIIPVKIDDTQLPEDLTGISAVRIINDDDFEYLIKGLHAALDD